MKKPESVFWFLNSIHKSVNNHKQDYNDQLSQIVSKVLEIKEYSLMDNIVNSAFLMDMDFKDNKYYQKYIDDSNRFIELVKNRGGEVSRLGTDLYSAAVADME